MFILVSIGITGHEILRELNAANKCSRSLAAPSNGNVLIVPRKVGGPSIQTQRLLHESRGLGRGFCSFFPLLFFGLQVFGWWRILF